MLIDFLTPYGRVSTSPKIKKGEREIIVDIKFTSFKDNIIYILDVSTINPSSPTYNNIETCGKKRIAATIREGSKIDYYRGGEIGQEYNIIPFIFECTGRMGGMAKDFIKELKIDKKKKVEFYREISDILAMANGECLSMAKMFGICRGVEN